MFSWHAGFSALAPTDEVVCIKLFSGLASEAFGGRSIY